MISGISAPPIVGDVKGLAIIEYTNGSARRPQSRLPPRPIARLPWVKPGVPRRRAYSAEPLVYSTMAKPLTSPTTGEAEIPLTMSFPEVGPEEACF